MQGAHQVNGPTRQCKAAGDVDASQLQAALQISAKELQSVAQWLQQEAVDAVVRSSREARFDEVILAEMRDALGLQRQQKRARLRAKNVADDFDPEVASKSVQLLVSAFQDVEACSTAQQRCVDGGIGLSHQTGLWLSARMDKWLGAWHGACCLEEFREQLLAQCRAAMFSVDSPAVQCFHCSVDGMRRIDSGIVGPRCLRETCKQRVRLRCTLRFA